MTWGQGPLKPRGFRWGLRAPGRGGGAAPEWAAAPGVPTALIPTPGPFPDRLQCLNLSTVSDTACQSVFPGRITDNMLCAGGVAGKDACQVSWAGPRWWQREGYGGGEGAGTQARGTDEGTAWAARRTNSWPGVGIQPSSSLLCPCPAPGPLGEVAPACPLQ